MGLFGLGKKQATFGLDIGSSSVKVVELAEGRGGFILEAFARVPLPRDVIADGAIREPGIVAQAVKEALDKAGIKGRSAVISVSGREAITKRVPLPKVGAKELADAIVLEAEHHIPFAVDDVFLDYQVVGESSNTMDVMVVAVKKVKVLEYVAAVEDAGIEPLVVDLDAFAIQNQYEFNNPGDGGEAVALIDIGASIMKTNVIRGGLSIFARDVPFGGHHYTEAIAQRLNIPSKRRKRPSTEERPRELGRHGARPGGGLARAVSRGAADLRLLRLHHRVRADRQDRALRRLRATRRARRVSLLVVGHTRRALPALPGAPGRLRRFPATELERMGPTLAVAVGLGLRRPGDKPA